jgi:hypothetical protein
MSVISSDLDSTVFLPGTMTESSQLLFACVFRSQIAFTYTDWVVAAAKLPFTASKTISFQKNGVEFATAIFPSGGTAPIVPTVVMPSEVTNFAKDTDVFTIVGPGTPDLTGGDIYLSFLGVRS